MRIRNLVFSAAAMAMVVAPVAAQAAEALAGTIVSGSGGVFVARGGELLPATPNMRLYAGDRVMTRAGGTARISLASGCSQSVGASSMATVGGAGCANVSGFDAGRAAYPGRSSALAGGPGSFVVVLLAIAAGGFGIYAATKKHHNGANATPVSGQ